MEDDDAISDDVTPEVIEPAAAPDELQGAVDAAAAVARQSGAAAAAAELMAFADAATLPVPHLTTLHDALWGHLSSVGSIEAQARARSSRDHARGWWQLAHELRTSPTLAEQRRRLDRWLQAWPDHPGSGHLPTRLQALRDAQPQSRRIGLLLPLSGPLGRAGRAVRDGFIASYLHHRDDVAYGINVYDAAAEPIATVYERALLDDNDLLIGPLTKESVAELNLLDPEIPVLALNYLDEQIAAPNLLQIGLAIEDEAYTLTRWLEDAGMRRVLLFQSRDDWSVRASRAVAETWPDPLEVQTLEDIRTVTESVGVAMRVAESRQRHSDLQSLLGEPIEFSPRARGDVDAIVALVTALEAAALVPALRFHFADGIPVFATSQTVRGLASNRLGGLNRFHVSELPWFVNDDPAYPDLDDAFDLDGNGFVSLYALGVDAFRLADRVSLLLAGTVTGLRGATGELDVLPDGRIQRLLARTEIVGGRLRSAREPAAE
jgi:uncharacterized protein